MKPERTNRGNHAVHGQAEAALRDQPFISHEWEELVEKLTASEDPKLRRIGLLEREFLKMRKSPRKAA